MAFDPQNIVLTETQVEALNFIEQIYTIEGLVPSADLLAEKFGVGVATAQKWLSSEEFDYLLTNKGITVKRTEGVLTTQQLAIANMIMNLNDGRSKRQKCEQVGITPQKLAVWMRDPTFKDYLRQRSTAMFGDADSDAYLNILRNIERGDLNAAKLYMEMTGKYTPASKREGPNLQAFVAGLIEILQARIGDPELLMVIAGDIEALMQGRPTLINPDPLPVKAIEAAIVSTEEPIVLNLED